MAHGVLDPLPTNLHPLRWQYRVNHRTTREVLGGYGSFPYFTYEEMEAQGG